MDNESIQTEEDLIGKKVGVIRDTVADTMISAKEGIYIYKDSIQEAASYFH